jgi:hypothetical protein
MAENDLNDWQTRLLRLDQDRRAAEREANRQKSLDQMARMDFLTGPATEALTEFGESLSLLQRQGTIQSQKPSRDSVTITVRERPKDNMEFAFVVEAYEGQAPHVTMTEEPSGQLRLHHVLDAKPIEQLTKEDILAVLVGELERYLVEPSRGR